MGASGFGLPCPIKGHREERPHLQGSVLVTLKVARMASLREMERIVRACDNFIVKYLLE